MTDYRLRPATIADADSIVHHRIAMFVAMGVRFDALALDQTFRPWLLTMMGKGEYRGWLIELSSGEVVAGGGFTIIAWPPGPRYSGDRLAFVYNMYTEPGHRGRGLARQILGAIHAWCRQEGITSLALNASQFGHPCTSRLATGSLQAR